MNSDTSRKPSPAAYPTIIYRDRARLWWDALPDDDVGAIGSNWIPVTREDAERFVAEMGGDGAKGAGWQRRHWNPPRY